MSAATAPASGRAGYFRGLPGWLCLLGGVSVGLYVGVLVLSFDFVHGSTDTPILPVLGLLAGTYVCYVLALFGVFSAKGVESEPRLVWTIVVFSAAYRLVLLPSLPILETDFYRYLWDGRVLLHGANPYWYTPAQVEEARDAAVPGGAADDLWHLAQQTEAVRTIFDRIHANQRGVPTVYPPLAQVVFAAAALATPAEAPLWVHVLVLKAVLVAFDLATLGMLVALLRALRLPTSWCVAYGWCPLVMKEFANSGHLDAIAVFLTTGAALLLTRRAGCVSDRSSRATAAMALLGLAVLAKSYPVVLLPVVTAYLLARFRLWAVLPLGAFAVVVVAGYLPFAGPAPPSAGPPDEAAPTTSHAGSGLQRFLTEWETNDFLFMLVYQSLRAPGEQPAPWFVVVPDDWRQELNEGWLQKLAEKAELSFRANPAFVLAQGIMGMVLLGLCLWWSWGVYRRPEAPVLLRALFLTLAWGWLLGSAQNPWYLIWALPFMLFAGCRSWFLLPGLVLLYYAGFWLERQTGASWLGVEEGLVWLEYVPFFVALLVEACWRRFATLHGSVACGAEC